MEPKRGKPVLLLILGIVIILFGLYKLLDAEPTGYGIHESIKEHCFNETISPLPSSYFPPECVTLRVTDEEGRMHIVQNAGDWVDHRRKENMSRAFILIILGISLSIAGFYSLRAAIKRWFLGKPYWLRGGFIGIAFYLLLYFSFFILIGIYRDVLVLGQLPLWNIINAFLNGFYLFTYYVPLKLYELFGCNFKIPEQCPGVTALAVIVQWINPIGIYFLIGALIGKIIEKRKKR